MIPKTIHYCWFGGKDLPEDAQKCIASWRKFLPDYEIKEWNEQNFDVNSIPYTAEAYRAGKYAFVSDYARMLILYQHGGLYFDTDVEVIKPLDDIVTRGPFMGYEIEPDGNQTETTAINPGLGIGAEPGMDIYKQIIDFYSTHTFYNADGAINPMAIVRITTQILKNNGLSEISGIQTVNDITIYPPSYFNPLNSLTGKLNISPETRSIHWYTKSWITQNKWRTRLSHLVHRLFGTSFPNKIKNLIRR